MSVVKPSSFTETSASRLAPHQSLIIDPIASGLLFDLLFCPRDLRIFICSLLLLPAFAPVDVDADVDVDMDVDVDFVTVEADREKRAVVEAEVDGALEELERLLLLTLLLMILLLPILAKRLDVPFKVYKLIR